MKVKKIGLLTAGGDCPGLNAVIRAVVKRGILDYGIEAIGFRDGFRGLVCDDYLELSYDHVSNILNLGGTILGSSNRDNPFKFYYDNAQQEPLDESERALETFQRHNLDALVCIGGDGTLTMGHMLAKQGINVVGVPKTIDNDVQGTDQTFGFATAVDTAANAIDKIRTTAESHHRVMIVELMGRTAGWLALLAGISSGSDIILIPEIPFDIDGICDIVKKRSLKGRKYSIVAVAEGASPIDGTAITKASENKRTGMARLGGIGKFLEEEIQVRSGIVCRTTVLGHLQRGGTPSPFDRILASRFGCRAVELVAQGIYDITVCLKGNNIEYYPLEKVANNPRLVPPDSEYIEIGKSLGTYFGN